MSNKDFSCFTPSSPSPLGSNSISCVSAATPIAIAKDDTFANGNSLNKQHQKQQLAAPFRLIALPQPAKAPWDNLQIW